MGFGHPILLAMKVWCGWFGFIFVSQAEGNALINVSKLSLGAVNATVGAASAGAHLIFPRDYGE